MPVDFLTTEQKAKYGKFPHEPSEVQLGCFFHLDQSDLDFILNRRGDQNRLGFALQLTSARFLGTFLSDLSLVPLNVQIYVASQLAINDVNVLADYANRETTKREHIALIREQYGYNEFNTPPWSFRLSRLLYTRSWVSNERPSLLFDFATSWLIQNKILLPGFTTLTRLISEIRERSDKRLWLRLSSLPTSEQKAKLETLLEVPEGHRTSRLDFYKKGPVTISSPAFNEAIDRHKGLKAFNMQSLDFSTIPPVRLKNLARHVGMITAYNIARMSEEKRIAILVAFVKTFEITALDDALDVLDLLITDVAGKAKNAGQKNRLRTLKDLDKSALVLAEVCALILNEETKDNKLRETIFSKMSKDKLKESISLVSLARPFDDNFHDEMMEQYCRVRRFLPRLLNDIEFKAAPAGKATLDAFNYLGSLRTLTMQFLKNVPLGIITNQWKRLVFDKESFVTKRGYILCFLNKLQDSLRRRDVYVEKSDRWGDPRKKLLQGIDWQANRIHVCRSLGHPVNPQEAISSLSQSLDIAYKQVADNFNNNNAVKLDFSGKHPSLTITNLEKLDEPPSLTKLNKQVAELLPKVDLTELLLEIHAHTRFADEFTHVSASNSRADDLTVSICAVLLSEACNIGLEPLIKHHIPSLTRHRLSWVKQNYVRAETLILANSKLVDYQATLSLAKKWGGGEVASADGMRFVTPTRTVRTKS